ncbi:helix-turn-helix domain-containing protein [Nocardia sp. NPDC051750]|uniref:helix-turn-helix domain-containing protein n=1 Tax=Nocardia sp. NPDC051750 TaxID=3364325 RepID=UPI0037AE8A10
MDRTLPGQPADSEGLEDGHSHYREIAFAGSSTGFLCRWTHRVGGGAQRVIPDNHADFIVSSTGRSWLVGPATTVDLPALSPGTVLHGARIHTAALRSVTGVAGSELRDTAMAVDDLLPGRVARALVGSLGAGEFDELTAHSLWPCLTVDPRVEKAVELLTAATTTVDTVADRVALTPRHLRRLVEQETGLTPKTLQVVGRLQRAVRLARRAPDATLSMVAVAVGYADQAHLSRDTRRMTGLTPGSLLG